MSLKGLHALVAIRLYIDDLWSVRVKYLDRIICSGSIKEQRNEGCLFERFEMLIKIAPKTINLQGKS